MTKKGNQRLTWSPAAHQAFRTLKERFTTAPILHHPNTEQEFIVEVDASSTGIGAVLSQRQGDPPKLYPCAFSPVNLILPSRTTMWAIENF